MRRLVPSALVFAVACGGASENQPPPKAAEANMVVTPSDASPRPSDEASPAHSSTSENWPFVFAMNETERAAQLERLKRDPGPIKSNWVPPGRSDRYGHAEGLIAAPVSSVRARLVDFQHYKDLAGPKFKTVSVVNKSGESTDVYFKLPIMRGIVTLSYVTRFPPARNVGSADVVEGTFVSGNIRGMHIAFTVHPAEDEKSTVLTCDLLLRLHVPAPQSALDEELRDACGDAIRAVRKSVVPAT